MPVILDPITGTSSPASPLDWNLPAAGGWIVEVKPISAGKNLRVRTPVYAVALNSPSPIKLDVARVDMSQTDAVQFTISATPLAPPPGKYSLKLDFYEEDPADAKSGADAKNAKKGKSIPLEIVVHPQVKFAFVGSPPKVTHFAKLGFDTGFTFFGGPVEEKVVRFTVRSESMEAPMSPIAGTRIENESHTFSKSWRLPEISISNGLDDLTVKIPNDIPPGLYHGTVDATLKGVTQSTTYDLDVRYNSTVPVVAILLAIFTGYFVRKALSSKEKRLDQLNQLMLRAKRAGCPSITTKAASVLTTLADEAILLSRRVRNDAAVNTIDTDIASLQMAVGNGEELVAANNEAEGHFGAGTPKLADWQRMADLTWVKLGQLDQTDVKGDILKLRSYFNDPNQLTTDIQALQPAPGNAALPVPAAALTRSTYATSRRGNPDGTRVRTLEWLKAELRERRVGLWLATYIGVAALAWTGLQATYSNVPGFGHAMSDWVALLSWGFAAGLAGKGIGDNLTAQFPSN